MLKLINIQYYSKKILKILAQAKLTASVFPFDVRLTILNLKIEEISNLARIRETEHCKNDFPSVKSSRGGFKQNKMKTPSTVKRNTYSLQFIKRKDVSNIKLEYNSDQTLANHEQYQSIILGKNESLPFLREKLKTKF